MIKHKKEQKIIENIINSLKGNKGNLRETLKTTDFKNIPELAIYMKKNNYKWNGIVKNYVQATDITMKKNQRLYKKVNSCIGTFKKSDEAVSEKNIEDINHTMEDKKILLFIKNNKEEIKKLIFEENDLHNIPRYHISGRNITKSLYMIDSVADLISKFSREKHISQREIAMIAFIEFFRKYGFEDEIDKVLN